MERKVLHKQIGLKNVEVNAVIECFRKIAMWLSEIATCIPGEGEAP
jgi:hypothetical protein